MSDAAVMITSDLGAERDLGRLAATTDVGALAPVLVGTAQLMLASPEAAPPDTDAVGKVVATVVAGLLP